MKVKTVYSVPTGHILIVRGTHGLLECLSLGDYGQAKNIKADFLGFTNEINGVPHGDLEPLNKKWVITVSTQYGCPIGCKFCDAPKVFPFRGNATFNDLVGQVDAALSMHPEVTHTERLNLHFARMGEPTLNEEVLTAAELLYHRFKKAGWGFHPVVSTMFPTFVSGHGGNRGVKRFLTEWLHLKNNLFGGNAGLQLSINTTDELQRAVLFNNRAEYLEDIGEFFRDKEIRGRKIALNFALSDAPIDATLLKEHFSPEKFMCKITPMHMTEACRTNRIVTEKGYSSFQPYKQVEGELKAAGYDVIVFVPSIEEDRGRITCGNAILGGTLPECAYTKEERG